MKQNAISFCGVIGAKYFFAFFNDFFRISHAANPNMISLGLGRSDALEKNSYCL
jgi:hypothetical protein